MGSESFAIIANSDLGNQLKIIASEEAKTRMITGIGGPTEEIVGALSTVEPLLLLRQIRKTTKEIQKDVRIIKEGPYHSGLTHLDKAYKRASDGDLTGAHQSVVKAQDRFIDAASMSEEIRLAESHFWIGVCHIYLGEPSYAKEEFLEAKNIIKELENHYLEYQGEVGDSMKAPLTIGAVASAGSLNPFPLIATAPIAAVLGTVQGVANAYSKSKLEELEPAKTYIYDLVAGFEN